MVIGPWLIVSFYIGLFYFIGYPSINSFDWLSLSLLVSLMFDCLSPFFILLFDYTFPCWFFCFIAFLPIDSPDWLYFSLLIILYGCFSLLVLLFSLVWFNSFLWMISLFDKLMMMMVLGALYDDNSLQFILSIGSAISFSLRDSDRSLYYLTHFFIFYLTNSQYFLLMHHEFECRVLNNKILVISYWCSMKP